MNDCIRAIYRWL